MLSLKCGKVFGLEVCASAADLVLLESQFTPASSKSVETQVVRGRVFCLASMAFKKDKLIGLSSQTESLKSSKTFLCAIGSSSLNVYSIGVYKLVQTFVDLWDYTTFDVASCTVAYPSNLPLKAEKREDQDLFFMDPEFSKKSPGAKATEIVSKVATGVTSMGEIGIKAFQNYLNPDAAADQKKVDEQDGVIVVRHLKRQNAPIIAHWKPHKHPISHIVFNSSQTLLYTCSTNGKTICAWSLLNSFHTSTKNILAPSCVMTFARGYTTALITDLTPSLDDRWLAVSTSRGTAHLYHIEPKYLVAAVRGTSSQASTIPVTLRVNSRNPLQVARSLLPQSPESLGSSPIYVLKPSSSVDHATSDLGFEDISLDTTKNVFCTAFGVGFKSLKDSSAKYPFVLFDPFGKLCATLIEPVSPGSGSSSFGVPLKFSVNVLIESSVCRTVDFKEVFSNRVVCL